MLCPELRIREVFKLIEHHNPLSGHHWHTHGPTTSYEVVGPLGAISRHRTEANAKRAMAEWKEHYERYDHD